MRTRQPRRRKEYWRRGFEPVAGGGLARSVKAGRVGVVEARDERSAVVVVGGCCGRASSGEGRVVRRMSMRMSGLGIRRVRWGTSTAAPAVGWVQLVIVFGRIVWTIYWG